MLDILKKTVYTGMGLAYMTTEKVQKIARDLADKAELSEEEGRKFTGELLEKSAEAKKAFESKTASVVESVMTKLRVPTRSEMDALEARVAELEAALKASGDESKTAK
ncbi:MAG: phasin family protein [Lentisphaeria bacterium]|nr:phasin family protein [Lentisphaeria bacterium]